MIQRDAPRGGCSRYGIQGLPTTFILNPQRTIADVLPGPQRTMTLAGRTNTPRTP